MTDQDWNRFLETEHQRGLNDEDIMKGFCVLFRDGKIERPAFEEFIGHLGYHLDDEAKKMSDEELRDSIIDENPNKVDGDPSKSAFDAQKEEADKNASSPSAEQVKKSGDYESYDDSGKHEGESESDEEKPEPKEGDGGESDDEEAKRKEKERAMRLFGLGK